MTSSVENALTGLANGPSSAKPARRAIRLLAVPDPTLRHSREADREHGLRWPGRGSSRARRTAAPTWARFPAEAHPPHGSPRRAHHPPQAPIERDIIEANEPGADGRLRRGLGTVPAGTSSKGGRRRGPVYNLLPTPPPSSGSPSYREMCRASKPCLGSQAFLLSFLSSHRPFGPSSRPRRSRPTISAHKPQP